MAAADGKVYARYEVDFRDRSLGERARTWRRKNVVLIDGYSTGADIPKIVGIISGIKPENVLITRMQLVGTE